MATRRVIASGNWSSPSTWENGIVPQNGDDVIHGSQYTVILDTTTAQLNSYTLNGALLFRNTGGVALRATTLSGNGVIDLNSLSNPDGAQIAPCKIIGLGSSPLDLTTLSSLFYYYSQIFARTLHASFWDISYMADGRIFPYYTSVSVSGSDLLLQLAAESNSPAAHFIANNNGNTFPVMLPLGESSSSAVTIYLRYTSAQLSGNTLRCFGQASYQGSLPVDGRRVPIVEHTSLCPVVFTNCKVPSAPVYDGVIFSDNCVGDFVQVVRAILRAPIRFKGEFAICFWDVYNPTVGEYITPQPCDATVLVWCGETHAS